MYTIAIHGGSGTINRTEITPEQEKAFREGLEAALDAGYKRLAQGGSALDAVEQAVRSLENNELFNAGKGAVFSATGKHELDASIMCGQSLKAGAIAGVTNVRNPITLGQNRYGAVGECIFCWEAGPKTLPATTSSPLNRTITFFTELRFQQLARSAESQ